MLIIGLTGGIGSGKTAVADLFAELNVPVIDADLIAHELVESGQPALHEIVQRFGTEILTAAGHLNREQLSQLVFSSKQRRRQLEAILHPRIRKEMQRQTETLSSPYALFVIPLLLETEQHSVVDRILVVDAPEALRRQRIAERDKRSPQEIDAIMASQVSQNQRLAAADEVIINNRDIDTLRTQVCELHHRYTLQSKKYK